MSSKNDINDKNDLIINKNNNNKTFKVKMKNILSKNIIALTKNKRKCPSPETIKFSFIKQKINKSYNKNSENIKNNNNYSNDTSKKNSHSPISFHLTNVNNKNKKKEFSFNNNKNNYNNQTLIRIKKCVRNSQKFLDIQNSREYYDNDNSSSIRVPERLYSQSSYNSSNKKKRDFSLKDKTINNTKNNNIIKIQKTKNQKLNIININRKKMNINVNNFDEEYYVFNYRKKSFNEKDKKIKINFRNNIAENINQNNKNIIIYDIHKKLNLMMNNIKIKTNSNERKMTIIQNFSKYKKKGVLNIKSNKNTKNNIYYHNNENISNNFCNDNKINNEVNLIKKINDIAINYIPNKNNEEKRKNENNNPQQKTDYSDNFYTN